ncbi:CDP-alcohol phosphatidyltransferase family protein [Candidatus Contendibacter odensensis]|uniref:CDP-diacylglycerol--glycerol-3-phosphate 3-phosphatidyltransferase n=1 Tax=Candidatus Contendobacter odensis Run_B_J11 TaxID=1400861 RepID=A0A7U7J5P6_9GAMM|nr:CDP-alcohol phosphatidyltransferase family protein [Candidatus Contendobacter odensis]CDH47606.1 Phosphoribosylglycinamide formyltransferase [Candidatus Contendobacter odensis Run_B_J11]
MALLPLKLCDIPNLITSLRILLVAPFLWLLLQERYGAALLLFVIAGISDALDGFLAKYYGWTSELGGLLDPIADKLLLMGAILALGWLDELPGWLVMLVILRDLMILGGAVAYHLLIERFQAAPLMISKLNTLIQLTLVCTIIIHYGLIALPAWLLIGLIYLTALTTLWSGAAYLWRWGSRAWHRIRRPPPPSHRNPR